MQQVSHAFASREKPSWRRNIFSNRLEIGAETDLTTTFFHAATYWPHGCCDDSSSPRKKSLEGLLTWSRKALELRVSGEAIASQLCEPRSSLFFDNLVVTTSILNLQPVKDWKKSKKVHLAHDQGRWHLGKSLFKVCQTLRSKAAVVKHINN